MDIVNKIREFLASIYTSAYISFSTGILLFLLLFLLFPIQTISLFGLSGIYMVNGMIVCDTEHACLHETGHRVDHLLDYPSKTAEFRAVVDSIYDMEYPDPNELGDFTTSYVIKTFAGINGNAHRELLASDWGGYEELYAELYAWSKEGLLIPPELQPFFGSPPVPLVEIEFVEVVR